jgi:hypothetical protein
MRVVLAAAAVLALAGCGQGLVVEADPAGTPYDGPMHVELDYADRAAVLAASGAAGQALECAGEPHRGGGAAYDSGLIETQDDPPAALENWIEVEGLDLLPKDGYRVERAEDGHVLYSWDVGDRTRVAVVVADHITDYNDDDGWGVEAWAACNPAEWPAATTDELDMQIWTTADGARVPTSEVTSFPGAEHCDWQDITFLWLGTTGDEHRRQAEYLRDTSGEMADFLTTTYDGSATLPEDATDTGWRYDGRQLWLAERPRAAYLVSVEDPTDVERWPASTRRIGCA